MSNGQRFELNQSTGLVMTAQMQQSMKILLMNNIELNQYVNQILETNPFLDSKETSVEKSEKDYESLKEVDFSNPAEATKDLDTDYQNIDPEATKFDISSNSDDYNSKSLIENLSSEANLKDFLNEQLQKANCSNLSKMIILHLIELVEDSGYLHTDKNEIKEKLKINDAQLNDALDIAKTFAPTGVFASSISECLEIQLKEKEIYDDIFEIILANLHLIANFEMKQLERKCRISSEELLNRIKTIKTLNPKPGASFFSKYETFAIPDVFVTIQDDGSYRVKLNQEILPKILLNKNYENIVKNNKNTSKTEFISEKYSEANWLLKAMMQRASTILAVATEIVKSQDGFLNEGITQLVPLKLDVIAKLCDVHTSTVSRVTSNKFIQTPRGVFEMKYFFSSSLTKDENEISSTAIKQRIKEIINTEVKGNVYSDEKIVELLQSEKIEIKRRTVAKYRESLNIPSSSIRKKQLLIA